ncbi:Ubiquitin-conjugating enzyme E2 [Liparis tanakae]|uniref:Ubiquitin-conjugating enzyme E2 n=1 Tax=Liparis tanakae TaxID=230148 RepID=A0A4Z2G4U1_9TELE|nr:Ubiquitin-conjugating enzyme E2 [Liparis tanakae]
MVKPDVAPTLQVTFRTRIYHCNINSQGVICLDILKDNWSFTLRIENRILCAPLYAKEAEVTVKMTLTVSHCWSDSARPLVTQKPPGRRASSL